jgi:hypothetical protein
MTITETMQAILEDALTDYGSPPTDLVPVSRIKGAGAHQNLARPYVIHQPLPATPLHIHGALVAMKRQHQVSIVGVSLEEVEEIAAALRAGMGNKVAHGIHTLLQSETPVAPDDTTESHQWHLTFSMLD